MFLEDDWLQGGNELEKENELEAMRLIRSLGRDGEISDLENVTGFEKDGKCFKNSNLGLTGAGNQWEKE